MSSSGLCIEPVKRQLKRLRQGVALSHPASVLQMSADLRQHLIGGAAETGTAQEIVEVVGQLRAAVAGLDQHERIYAEVDLNLSVDHNYPTLTDRQESLARSLKCASKTVRRRSDQALDTLALLLITRQRNRRVGNLANEAHEADRDLLSLVTSGSDLLAALVAVVDSAKECLVSVGSRSREPSYLEQIEAVLVARPNLMHYRVLIGPLHSDVLKEHLLQLLDLRDDRIETGGARVQISILDDLSADHERFFVASERAAVVMLPSATSPSNFDTALIVRDPAYARALLQHGIALGGRRRLATADAVKELEVLR